MGCTLPELAKASIRCSPVGDATTRTSMSVITQTHLDIEGISYTEAALTARRSSIERFGVDMQESLTFTTDRDRGWSCQAADDVPKCLFRASSL